MKTVIKSETETEKNWQPVYKIETETDIFSIDFKSCKSDITMQYSQYIFPLFHLCFHYFREHFYFTNNTPFIPNKNFNLYNQIKIFLILDFSLFYNNITKYIIYIYCCIYNEIIKYQNKIRSRKSIKPSQQNCHNYLRRRLRRERGCCFVRFAHCSSQRAAVFLRFFLLFIFDIFYYI